METKKTIKDEEFSKSIEESKKSKRAGKIETRLMTQEEKKKYKVETYLVPFALYNKERN